MQNILIGDLFHNRLSPRVPLDGELVVVQLDRYQDLKNYFERESAWGRSNAAIVAQVKAGLAENVGKSSP
ncbi:MAG: hypothetical protein WDM92_13775 [Caulobacteraceae bacterium]